MLRYSDKNEPRPGFAARGRGFGMRRAGPSARRQTVQKSVDVAHGAHVYVMLDAFGLFQLIRAAVDAAQQAVEHVVPV